MIVIAIIGILAASPSAYANVQARARIAKAQADARPASAVSITRAQHRAAYRGLSVLTVVAVNTQPVGWSVHGDDLDSLRLADRVVRLHQGHGGRHL
jgi:hypothetical protein